MALFIGGAADGWRLEVDSTRNTVPIAVTQGGKVDIVEYRKEIIRCDRTDHTVFAPKDWSCTDIVNALITNYKKADLNADEH